LKDTVRKKNDRVSDRCRFEVRTEPCIRPMKVQEKHFLITQSFLSIMYVGMNILMSKNGQYFHLV